MPATKSTVADPLAAWDALDPDIRGIWKIDPKAVLSAQKTNGAGRQYVALTATARYCWTYLPSRLDWTCRKTPR